MKMMVKYELKKIFVKRQNRMLLILLILVTAVFIIFAAGSIGYVDQAGEDVTSLRAGRMLAEEKNQWQGELTGEVIADVVAAEQELHQQYPDDMIPGEVYAGSQQTYLDIYNLVNSILNEYNQYDWSLIHNITLDEAADLYSIREDRIEAVVTMMGETEEQRVFLREIYNKVATPLYYEAADTWKTMLTYVNIYTLVLVLLIGFFAAGIFSDESVFRADAIFFSSKYGRGKAIRSKILSGVIMTTVVYWGSISLFSLISFGIMGTSGYNTPYQIEHTYSIYNITYAQGYLLFLLAGYVASLLSAALAMLVSAKTHSANIAICVPFVVFGVFMFIGPLLSFDTVIQLTPDNLTTMVNCIGKINIYQIGDMVFRQVPFLILFIVLCRCCYYR